MKSKMALLLTIALLLIIPMVPNVSAQATNGPHMDRMRLTVIRTPEAARIAMLADLHDSSPGQILTSDIEVQAAAGMLVTQDLGFHMGYMAYNIRDLATIQSYWRPSVTYWPLHDVEFRHALIHCYDQLAIIPPLYGYVVTPVRSLVPPAQSKYYNTAVEAHPYNPGNPFTSPSGEHSSVGILKAAGYTFVDADTSGTVTDADYWEMPNSDPLDEYVIWTPLITTAPTSYEHGAEFVADLAGIGLASTTANGNRGLINEGREFSEYLDDVYGTSTETGGRCDGYMVFHGLTRIPAQLYFFLHSSQDNLINVAGSNGPGVNNATIDTLCEQVRYSIDPDDIEVAAKDIQERLYDVTLPGADSVALAYMLMYSRSYFDVYSARVEGVVRSPGYGSDNPFTLMNIRFQSGQERLESGETVYHYINGLPPSTYQPTFCSEVYEWNVVLPCIDPNGITSVNPYNHYDIPWFASDWAITETATGMEVDFTLRDDVYWQDGYQYTAADAEFSLEGLRDFSSINWFDSSQRLIDVAVTGTYTFTVNASAAGLSLFYSYAGSSNVLPPQIYNRTWVDITAYDPTAYAYGTDMAPGYSPGPWAANVPTNLMGMGPFIYQLWDAGGEYNDLWANRNYFMDQAELATLMSRMFWEVGDYTGHPSAAIPQNEGTVNVVDLTYVSFAFGSFMGDPDWDVAADFNENLFVGIEDLSNSAFHLLWERTYSA